MFSLSDFHHLPQLDFYVQQIARQGHGLVVVAGLGQIPDVGLPAGRTFLPSGRSLILTILLQEMLKAQIDIQALVISQDKSAFRLNRPLRDRISYALVDERNNYAQLIEQAALRNPGLVVVDQLNEQSIPAALRAARQGVQVLSQLDTVMFGSAAVRQLVDWGGAPEDLPGLSWIVGVQRVETLCQVCKKSIQLDEALEIRLRRRFPHLIADNPAPATPNTFGELALPKADFYNASGCDRCRESGRGGEISAFDVFKGGQDLPPLLESESLLPIEEYLLHLAALGSVSVEDALNFPAEQMRRTYHLMELNGRMAVESDLAMKRKLAELEAANRVNTQRTSMLVSLHDISQTLISSTDLEDLASKVCRHAREICHADRAILYYLKDDHQAEILATNGLIRGLEHQAVDPAPIKAAASGGQIRTYLQRPPGVPAPGKNQREEPVQAGLLVPLVTHERQVGALIIQSVQRQAGRASTTFPPGEVALLETLAGQAALAMQRAGLIEELRQKISQLEAAQAELVKKERLDHELQIARQVQQSLLPLAFPEANGYVFEGRCEPARQIGGDFYDAFWIDDGHIGLAIADVAGKGMPAALFMALSRSLLLAEARRSLSPSEALHNVNRLLWELSRQQTFVTVFYAVLDTHSRQLTYSRAGHERPMLLRGGQVQPLPGDGVALGVFEDISMETTRLDLQSGDRLVLYTDGLTDVLSPSEERYELQRLKELFQAYASLPADQLCSLVFDSLAEYQGGIEQYDDMTMLILEVH